MIFDIKTLGLMLLTGVITFIFIRLITYLGLKLRYKFYSSGKIKEMDKKFDFTRHAKIASYLFAIFAMIYFLFLYGRLI